MNAANKGLKGNAQFLFGTLSKDSVGNKIIKSSHSNAAMMSKHKNPTIRSSNQQSNNSQI